MSQLHGSPNAQSSANAAGSISGMADSVPNAPELEFGV